MSKIRGLFDHDADYGLGNGDPYGLKSANHEAPRYLTAEDNWGRPLKGTQKDDPWGMSERCYHKHPPLKIGEHLIYGGSCSSPVVQDADVYVGFDSGIRRSAMAYPWTKGTEFLYRIQDMHAPDDPASFLQLIAYLAEQLQAGKRVHIGCVGGHGRTGTVLAALVTHMTGEKDSISYVRRHYCKKAVESAEQVRFLSKHFGITPTDGYKKAQSGVISTGGVHKLPAIRSSAGTRTCHPIPDAKLAIW